MNTPVLQWEQLRDKKKKRLESLFLLDNLAEREGPQKPIDIRAQAPLLLILLHLRE